MKANDYEINKKFDYAPANRLERFISYSSVGLESSRVEQPLESPLLNLQQTSDLALKARRVVSDKG
jgi:hypothetical protein